MTYAGDLSPQQTWEGLVSDPQAVLVDVRTQAEWAFVGVADLTAIGKEMVPIEWSSFPTGTLNGAFLQQLHEAVPLQAPVYFLCRSGARSAAAAEAATAAGWTSAYNVLDGFEGPVDEQGHRSVAGWKQAGLPWRQG
ncbi:rhodanese-like domain-containing protein [Janibacter cremeus]|uniref:Rhodanese-related sulfurtransferase n=1 Tax=Janibacter cremeus TaxID=1285192 RepID=A0A852VZ49_9MICO|nr:rhodanese-like domain-containing protein [Janibacter cremeus]NYF99474.1 rhodanese-related sulfurtransferase [Janibacter cremeus]